ncbi:uncharacterized protein DNG_07564 [Cephalotrichum gorgonifer]|uniref:EngB-type G domain-containing protein n=1 Tax=Cephalotrichum gorgonifer TaxID=2041049 RepID=A0AAE8N3J7_9PEZI|nr:uncharacterized protein DNG_07564 [Cephalotrichum gorgonifer]
MPLLHPRDLLAIPSPLRSLLLTRLLTPTQPARYMSTWDKYCETAARTPSRTPPRTPTPASTPPRSPRGRPAPTSAPTPSPRGTPAAAPIASGESLLDLWNTPAASISSPRRNNPQGKPVLSTSARASDLRDANNFFFAKKPDFLYSAVSWRSHEVNYYVPEVCVLGCSNAGKSTFINALMGTGLARSSSRPGSTRAMNAYATGPVVPRKVVRNQNVKASEGGGGADARMDLLRGLVLMDTPGYGFNSIQEWGEQIEVYLERRTMLKGVILLLRSDVPLTKWDVEVLGLLAHLGKKTTVVLTRADRCGEGRWVGGCLERYEQVMDALRDRGGKGTAGGGDWTPDVCITAAGMAERGAVKGGKLKRSAGKEEAGMGGARIAVLRLAGLIGPEARVKEPAPEPWVGRTISWDSIPVKGA